MYRAFLAVCGLCLSAWGFAQNSVNLTFPSSSTRQIWLAEMPPDALPEKTVSCSAGTFEYKAANPGSSDQLFIWDEVSGNLAFKLWSQLNGQWTLKESDFRYIMQVNVRVEHKGKPVESAVIRLKDGRQDLEAILDSSRHGVVSFFAVKPGSLSLEVTYSSQGKTQTPLAQSNKLALQRTSAIPTVVISIADPVATTDEASTESNGGKGEGSEQSDGSERGSKEAPTDEKGRAPDGKGSANPIGSLISFLIAVGVAIAVFLFLLKWVRNNQAMVQNKLQDMGVQVPRVPDADPASTTQASPVVVAPMEKIVLDDAAPNLASPPADKPATIKSPKLVGVAGETFHLAEGEAVVSRESGDIVLSGESTVSRRHAVLRFTNGALTVRDEGSTNGTFVNGRQATSETELRIGDTVQFGSVKFRVEG